MKRICLSILLVILLGLFATPAAQAAPVAPELQVSITPPDGTVMPGQLVLVYAGGGFPLEVQGTLDGEPLTFFWSGDGYVAPIAFDLEAPPGTHQLVVTAAEPGGGRTRDFQATLTVKEDTYPEEYINIGGPLADLLDPSWVHRYGGAKRPQGEFEAVDGFGCNPSPKHASDSHSEKETALSGSSGRNRR